MRRFLPLVLCTVIITACDRGASGEAAAVAEERERVALDACIALALLDQAEDNLETLEQLGQMAGADAGSAAGAALAFARAFEQHARLRAAALVRADSAANHARTPADSARYMEVARGFLPRPAEPETLEANVANSWLRDFGAILENEDHRCHWDR